MSATLLSYHTIGSNHSCCRILHCYCTNIGYAPDMPITSNRSPGHRQPQKRIQSLKGYKANTHMGYGVGTYCYAQPATTPVSCMIVATQPIHGKKAPYSAEVIEAYNRVHSSCCHTNLKLILVYKPVKVLYVPHARYIHNLCAHPHYIF